MSTIHIHSQEKINTLLENNNPGITVIQFDDWQNTAITDIPAHFFNCVPDVEFVAFNKPVEELPLSLYDAPLLKGISLWHTKIKSFSEKITSCKNLESLHIREGNKSINWQKEFPKLATLPRLVHLEIHSIRGNSFPGELALLQQLQTLKIGNDLLKKTDPEQLINVVTKIKSLKKLIIDSWYNSKFKITGSFSQLDFLDEIVINNFSPEDLPASLALFKHAKLSLQFSTKQDRWGRTSCIVDDFFKLLQPGKQYSDWQKEVLFYFWTGNFHGLRALIPNKLTEPAAPSFTVKFSGTVKKDKLKQYEQALSATKISIVKKTTDAADLAVLLPTITFEEAEKLITSEQQLILEDHLNEYITSLGDHYLLVEENEALNEELIRLLASNQPENYLLAFQLIESGGANKTVQSLLAAIHLAHPDKKIQKEAAKQFEKYCSVAYQEYIKKTQPGISLRRSGNAGAAFRGFSTHPDINREEFILMYQKIAGDNPNIKDVEEGILHLKEQAIIEIPAIFKFFNIITLTLDKNPSFDITKSMDALQAAHTLKELSLAGSHIKIPDLSGIRSLQRLNISYNEVDNCDWLQEMDLQELDIEGCRIAQWDWLNKQQHISVLNISGNRMDELPGGIFTNPVTKLTCRNNKLKTIDERLASLSSLKELDMANNDIDTFPAFLLKFTDVNLRSNKIAVFEAARYGQVIKEEDIRITSLDIANNELDQLELGSLNLKTLTELDISGNKLETLEESVFNNTSLRRFEANNNQIKSIPKSAVRSYERFWLEKNKITELPEYLNALQAGNLNLKNNLIETIHSSFFTVPQGYARGNWKIDGNPVTKTPGFSSYSFSYPGRT
ncbi:MAG: leucine-rich repeat domain-containing protein [Ferruginibacter sp.]